MLIKAKNEARRTTAEQVFGAMCARYEYKEDRFDFQLWLKNPGPRGKRYWSLHHAQPVLILELVSGGHGLRLVDEGAWPPVYRDSFIPLRVFQVAIDVRELTMPQPGWRRMIADHLKLLRNHLRKQST
jgi:hypothetical protein